MEIGGFSAEYYTKKIVFFVDELKGNVKFRAGGDKTKDVFFQNSLSFEFSLIQPPFLLVQTLTGEFIGNKWSLFTEMFKRDMPILVAEVPILSFVD